MDSKEESRKFQEGIRLLNTEDKIQDGANILMELAEDGHIDSIEQLCYIFLDQREFGVVQDYIDCAKNPKAPIILYLKARLIEERDGAESALESFREAAKAGNPNAISLLLDVAIQDGNIVDAEFYFDQMRPHENFLTRLSEPATLEDLEQELINLRYRLENENEEIDTDKLSEIYPVYFALASGNWMRSRNDINERYEDHEAWESFLAENDLTPEEFDRYEQWWISPVGRSVVASLAGQFMDSVYEAASVSSFKVLEEFFTKHAVWDDFIRELSQCTPADGESLGGGPSYFAEYSIGGGLCYSDSDDPEFDQELITEVMESWFNSQFEDSQRILLSAYDEITKIL